jgi:hypothetical protein
MTRSSALQRLEPFVGAWTMEAPLALGVRGTATFEWSLGEQFLLHRSEIPVPGAPDALSIIALNAGGQAFTMHYFDSRGVVRLYAMTMSDGVWTLSREAPDFTPLPFHQRFTGTFSHAADAIDGRWETSADGVDWKLDFELAYTRSA